MSYAGTSLKHAVNADIFHGININNLLESYLRLQVGSALSHGLQSGTRVGSDIGFCFYCLWNSIV